MSNRAIYVPNSGGMSIIEVVERGPQGLRGLKGDAGDATDVAITVWNAETDYAVDDIVEYGSLIYIATQPSPAGTLPTDTSIWDAYGIITPWQQTKANYQTNDKVEYLDGIYNALSDNIPAGTLPTDTIYWSRMGDGSVTDWNANNPYTTNDKVNYLDSIYNAIVDVPAGTLPTDTNFWRNLASDPTVDSQIVALRGGTQPTPHDVSTQYSANDRVTFSGREYRCNVTTTTGAFDPTEWAEVSVQSNELRLNELERVPDVEYEFTQTVAVGGDWAVTNAGETQAEFDSPNIQFFFNGIKLRKGTEVTWVSENVVRLAYMSVINEDFLTIVVTLPRINEPSEVEYTQTRAINEAWSVGNVGSDMQEFESPNIKIYFNGVMLRKGTEVVWIGPTQVSLAFVSVVNEDFLTIRNEV